MGKFLKQCDEDELCFVRNRKEKNNLSKNFKKCVFPLVFLGVGIAWFLSGFGFGIGQFLNVYKAKSESKECRVTPFVSCLILLQVIGLGGLLLAVWMIT
mmetsp:Transcript_15881/g.22579  ORF Transcript_15881/g.22579 Transcript_15881/m.22579 type:complete len:99 (-) Transcript_15881:26-322(-)